MSEKMNPFGLYTITPYLIGDSVVMMGEPMDEISAMPATLYLYVEDCDFTYEKALEAGASSVLEPDNYPHGDRFGGIKDPTGNIWWVVTHIGTGNKEN